MPQITDREDSLVDQVQALELVLHALNDLFLNENDPDESDNIRARTAEVREELFVKQAELDGVRAMSIIPPVSDAERDNVLSALADLDKFVLADQEEHAALEFLTQVADRISKN